MALPIPFNNPATYPGHSGIDFAQSRGTPFRASGSGVIGLRSYNSRGGNMVWVDYDGYPGVAYAHLDNYNDSPPVGTRVREGDIIGRVGNTGNSTGPHLHMEVYGHATTDGFWRFFDRNRVVGSGSGAGGSSGSDWPARELYGETWVRYIQEKLNRLGYGLEVDGFDGPATQKAVMHFQGIHGLVTDGVAGPATNAKLDQVLSGDTKLIVDGVWGADTTRALQRVLGVPVDGELGSQTIGALQAKLGVTVDGAMGPQTASALQTLLGVPIDGEIGQQTTAALQTYLNNGGNFGTPPAPSDPEKLVVDGEWGPATTKALQLNLGIVVDGELGPITVKALQKAIGQTEDGQMGSMTIKALQMNVGASVDGALGPETVKRLQEFLNNNGVFKAVVVEPDEPVVTYPKPEAPTYPESVWWHHSPNSSPRREGDKIEYFVIHHAADPRPVEVQRDRFMAPNDRSVSPNWLIGADGTVHEIVPPDNFRAWTTGQFDYKAVTVETQNTSGAPDWGISEESHVAIAKLVAWAHKRWGIPLDRQHVLGHREVPGVSPTACPGPSMDLDKILDYAIEFASDEPDPDPDNDAKKARIAELLDEALGLVNEL